MADPFDFERPERYAVMGNPAADPKWPQFYPLFAHQFKHRIDYSAIQVDPGGLAQAVEQFRAAGGKGLDVTTSFERDAFRLADHTSERARIAGAVSTMKLDADGRIFGDQTEGAGLVRDLAINLDVVLRAKPLLLLGAGDGARTVLAPLLRENPERVVLADRTLIRAKALAGEFAAYGTIEPLGYDALRGKRFGLVINTIGASAKGEMPPLPESLLARDALVYDLTYGDRPTAFMEWALLHGAGQVADGLGMRIEQAAESYFLWKGVRPDTRPVIAVLRKAG